MKKLLFGEKLVIIVKNRIWVKLEPLGENSLTIQKVAALGSLNCVDLSVYRLLAYIQMTARP